MNQPVLYPGRSARVTDQGEGCHQDYWHADHMYADVYGIVVVRPVLQGDR